MNTSKELPSSTDISRLIDIYFAMQSRGVFHPDPNKDVQHNQLIDLGGPRYSKEFSSFLLEISAPIWTDMSYSSGACAKKLRSKKLAERCTLSALLKLLTFCCRSDRFCTGFLESKVTDGSIFKIITRLSEIDNAK